MSKSMRFTVPVLLSLAALLVCGFSPLVLAAEPAGGAETKAEVPALSQFHEVIARIWHEAWPNKDTALLVKLAPDVRAGAAKVAEAKLPGILRDKEAAWTGAVGELKAIVQEYSSAAEAKDDTRLMATAERLHSQFEKLVRTIRPALKELDAFHVVLYRLYHRELPAGDVAAIKVSAAELMEKMGPLNKAALPQRLAAKKEAFEQARTFLDEAVVALAAGAQAAREMRPVLKNMVETVHTQYQKLEAVFD